MKNILAIGYSSRNIVCSAKRAGYNAYAIDAFCDIDLAGCAAGSRIIDPGDQMARYLRWYRQGYLSSTGTCFDIGNTIRSALLTYERTGQSYAGATHPRSAGNGSIMRLAPLPLFFARHPEQVGRPYLRRRTSPPPSECTRCGGDVFLSVWASRPGRVRGSRTRAA